MVFNSLQYAVFLPVVLLVMVPLRGRVMARNAFLLAASYLFYGSWNWRFLILLIGSTLVDYGVGVWMGTRPEGEHPELDRKRKRILVLSLFTNLGILCFFKYFDFFAQSVQASLAALHVDTSLPLLHVVLPVGISFYTFQSMSYTIDVYRGKLAPERNLLTFAFFVACFPQLVAGPIERASHLLPQLRSRWTMDLERFNSGWYLIGAGLFKKVVLADNAALVADKVFGAHDPAGITSILGVYAFAIQIFCDFSGYTDIARGSARLLGLELMDNFDHPYFATNPSDFWRRWHISLSTWLRDYLYIPLGGNRKGPARTYFNLMATMTLGGLWHGAAWNFVIWGVFHGALLCAHRLASPWLERVVRPRAGWQTTAWLLVRIAVFFQITCVGWLIFRAHSAGQIGQMLGSLLRPRLDREVLHDTDILALAACGLTLLLMELAHMAGRERHFMFRWPVPARAVVYAAGILGFILFGNYQGVQFIYFQF